MLARCQLGLDEDGRCGATLTYPIKGMSWRRNIRKSFEFDVDAGTAKLLLLEVSRIKQEFPSECLSTEDMWNDTTEKANGISRDRRSAKICCTIAVLREHEAQMEYYSLKEDSKALLT